MAWVSSFRVSLLAMTAPTRYLLYTPRIQSSKEDSVVAFSETAEQFADKAN